MVSRHSVFNLCNLETLMGGVRHSKAAGSFARSFQFFLETVDLCFIRKNFVLYFGQWCLHWSRLMSGCTVGQLFLGPKKIFF